MVYIFHSLCLLNHSSKGKLNRMEIEEMLLNLVFALSPIALFLNKTDLLNF